ncbi:hypothetical protein QYF61_014065 [Mycteria americana]|uniref:Uncharacterized protein n=1 Tax=Mycteria americana TaxID=33587 RepID=A0AAN7MSJ6_MYCAM|nr:hypothetical protein QYF61_014065 [Mycteria americana]
MSQQDSMDHASSSVRLVKLQKCPTKEGTEILRLQRKLCGLRHSFNLNKGSVRLNIGKKCFTMRVVRHWHRLPIEAVDAPSLEVFKVRLDGALSNLV